MIRKSPLCSRVVQLALALGLAMTFGGAGASSASAARTTQTTTAVTYDRSCEQQTDQSQIALDECAATELREVQSQLTTLLNRESEMFGRKSVNQAEAQWRRFRDLECALQAKPNKGGTIVPLVIGDCDVQLTIQRIQELSAFLNTFPR